MLLQDTHSGVVLAGECPSCMPEISFGSSSQDEVRGMMISGRGGRLEVPWSLPFFEPEDMLEC